MNELAKIPLQRINAGPGGQPGAQLTLSAAVLMSHQMQNLKWSFELSWLRTVPMELVKELSKTPLERCHAGDLGDSCRGSLTSNEVPTKVLNELTRPLLQRIGASSTSRCICALALDTWSV